MGGVGAGAGQQQSTASSAAAASSRLQRETAVREMDCVCVFQRVKHGLRGYSIPRHSASGARERRVCVRVCEVSECVSVPEYVGRRFQK